MKITIRILQLYFSEKMPLFIFKISKQNPFLSHRVTNIISTFLTTTGMICFQRKQETSGY